MMKIELLLYAVNDEMGLRVFLGERGEGRRD